ncbi:Hermansky-Pudlak syndrome 3 protein isoform X2 [Puntigrus tetrazona]|uniref:Hermansky-Pudlak syndrome 3 protein isoform X2 n=1 Tax=Puntigrus tetrazona TaxID=1606681 RepID=UPI001C897149|nr:Hermansky-Pudlak syndrome 3 protein isoform X2 [Puntigrus tetrazona]
MVHVYNCHPFASQHIVPAEQEPVLVCCGGGALFVVGAGGCKVEAYNLQQEGCPLICRFSCMGSVLSIRHSAVGDYLVTIEEKNKATYLRAYTNWRYQAAEKTRVGVRLLGHLLRGSSFRGTPKEQMEIIEIPLFEPPLCMACCGLTGDLLVGCAKSLVVFSLKRQTLSEQLSVLDFERVLILHIQGWSPTQVAFCGEYIALQTELEVLVVKLSLKKSSQVEEEHTLLPEDFMTETSLDEDAEMTKDGFSPLHEQEDFFLFPKHQEMLGNEAQECGVSIVLEWTGMEDQSRGDMSVAYVLFRRFAPDFFQGCSVEETHLHSLQLHPMFTSNQEEASISKGGEPTCMFVFFSLPNTGYMYSLKDSVELVSTYQYPEKAHQAVLSDQFLYVITRNALQCFTVRCSAVAARVHDPYIDTTMKACPPITMEVCALRIQLFIGLKIVCQDGNHIVLLTAADVDSKEDTERPARKNTSRKSSVCKPTEPADSGHGWNLYVITSVSTLQLYREIVEYSKRYEQSSPSSQSCIHLLSEGHLLLRAALLAQDCESAERAQLQEAFQESCAHLGDCFSRFDKKDCHLALPYYKMSGLTVTEVIKRNMSMNSSSDGYGKGFIFFLKHSLYEETMEELSKDMADKVLEIFSVAEPAQLPHVVSSPSMLSADPDHAVTHLRQLESRGAQSITLSLCMASLALRKGDLHSYRQQMDRHAEMLQVYGFIEEPKLLLHGRGKAVLPTILAQHLCHTQDGLLVAAVVALHENSKIRLDEADLFFQELCKDGVEADSSPQLLVDFWEALLVASSHESIIQELLFRLTSVYIDRITRRDHSGVKALKTAEDLINSCSHYGMLYPWVSILTPVQFNITYDHQEDLHKLQSLLCGPTLEVLSILPLLEQLSDSDSTGLSVHVLCATKLGQHETSIHRLLDRCPEAIISYANHELQNDKLSLWWQKLFPEVCDRIRTTGNDNTVLLSALKETLAVAAKELNPLEFLDLLPDDGTAHFFLPHLLECSQ